MRRFLGFVVLCLASPSWAVAGSYYCEAQGVYANCVTENGYETCKDVLAAGAGHAPDRGRAESDAIVSCSNHMRQMVIIGNYPTGSSYKSQRSIVKSGCAISSCKLSAETAKQPDPQSFASEADRLLAEGDQLFRDGDRAGATNRWEAAIAADPGRAEPYGRIGYVLLLDMQHAAACQQFDRGLQAVPSSASLRLVRVECLIYQRQPEAAQEAAIQLMQSGVDADTELGANLLGWVASSLAAGSVAPCPRLAAAIGQRQQLPGWDLGPLSVFLATYGSAADAQILGGLAAIAEGPGSAGRLAALCGGGG